MGLPGLNILGLRLLHIISPYEIFLNSDNGGDKKHYDVIIPIVIKRIPTIQLWWQI